MKVCFDVNVIFDMLGRRLDFPESFFAYDVACLRRFDVFMAASSTPTIDYLLSRAASVDHEATMGFLFELFDVIDVTESDCLRAFESDMPDYEDALIAEAAARCGMDVIVTRDAKGFEGSPVKSMTPAEFVEAFKPRNVVYELAELPEI